MFSLRFKQNKPSSIETKIDTPSPITTKIDTPSPITTKIDTLDLTKLELKQFYLIEFINVDIIYDNNARGHIIVQVASVGGGDAFMPLSEYGDTSDTKVNNLANYSYAYLLLYGPNVTDNIGLVALISNGKQIVLIHNNRLLRTPGVARPQVFQSLPEFTKLLKQTSIERPLVNIFKYNNKFSETNDQYMNSIRFKKDPESNNDNQQGNNVENSTDNGLKDKVAKFYDDSDFIKFCEYTNSVKFELPKPNNRPLYLLPYPVTFLGQLETKPKLKPDEPDVRGLNIKVSTGDLNKWILNRVCSGYADVKGGVKNASYQQNGDIRISSHRNASHRNASHRNASHRRSKPRKPKSHKK